ncbi:DnaJ-domain-containing protein [Lojkania enalia]|uniref:DnaJ-domain-containing protein n=1 Tax=Lojkania enalia TaxID=147567 RepID=A0A9P4K118_9PLEO|nr:DnaJ-domain-containing protein [Didymosphaeria enalia]
MGASQSTGAGSAPSAGEVKTSYYELLGVERSATDDEIKKAYRRKAFELHPDRNYGDVDRATALFAEIQSAYEVLSDPQERAWYDAHEGDILSGGDGGGEGHYEHNMKVTTADDISRLMGRFRSNVEFSDAPTGFYGFLREFFDQLAKEEENAADWEGVSIPNYPTFGHKDDEYDDVVRSFYVGWSGFSTRKTFAWKDKYRLSDAPDRRVRRLMEKENRRFRDEGIRAFNDAVRALVLFVRKRDLRYTPNTQTEEARAKAQREARQAQAARSRAAQAAKLQQEDAVPAWARTRDSDEEVVMVEEDEDEEIEEEHYECVACHKTFKSDRQFEAHEKSKKHQKAVQALKRKMQKDNFHLNLDENVTSSVVITPVDDEGSVDAEDASGLGESVDHIANDVENIDIEDNISDSTAPINVTASPAFSDVENSDDEYASRSDIEARLTSHISTMLDSKLDTSFDHIDPEPTAPKLGKAAQKRAKRAAKQAELDQSGLKFTCAKCNAGFPSKTQLFQHLKSSGHAALKSDMKAGGMGKPGKRK